jgi:hypothetical protein
MRSLSASKPTSGPLTRSVPVRRIPRRQIAYGVANAARRVRGLLGRVLGSCCAAFPLVLARLARLRLEIPVVTSRPFQRTRRASPTFTETTCVLPHDESVALERELCRLSRPPSTFGVCGLRAIGAEAGAQLRPCHRERHKQRGTEGSERLFDWEAADVCDGAADHWKISVVQSPPWRRTSCARAGPPERSWKSTKNSGSISMPPSGAQFTRSSQERRPG